MGISASNRFLLNAVTFGVSALLSYMVAEAGYSYCYRYGLIDQVRDGWFFEEAGQTIHFDPVVGYTLTQVPSRNVRVTEGKIEYEGIFRGNNQGFQDRDDFSPARPAGNPLRVAVLGDSFSSGQFMAVNWPDRVEDIAAGMALPRPLQLLNFSLYSGGLVNWRNILLERIEKAGYELDLLVIPVFANDLFRPFMLFEARDTRKLLIGRAGLDPDRLPGTLEEARAFLSESDGYILTAGEWKQMREQGWHPELPRPVDRYLFRHLSLLVWIGFQQLQALLDGVSSQPDPAPPAPDGYIPDPSLQRGRFTPEHVRLIEDVRQSLQRQRLPVLVVRIPDRDELLNEAPVAGNVVEFAELLGAPLVDGAQAFAGLDATGRRAQYFPYDGHWNQQGSDHFASFMQQQLQIWQTHNDMGLRLQLPLPLQQEVP